MIIFGWRGDAVAALINCNKELKRMHKLLNCKNIDFDMTKTEIMDRIIKLQNTLDEGTRKICGLEY